MQREDYDIFLYKNKHPFSLLKTKELENDNTHKFQHTSFNVFRYYHFLVQE